MLLRTGPIFLFGRYIIYHQLLLRDWSPAVSVHGCTFWTSCNSHFTWCTNHRTSLAFLIHWSLFWACSTEFQRHLILMHMETNSTRHWWRRTLGHWIIMIALDGLSFPGKWRGQLHIFHIRNVLEQTGQSTLVS